MENIAQNLQTIKERIAIAAERSGRSAEDITLVAVTKLHEADEINTAIRCGITDIAENKVQELVRKFDSIEPACWHLIGHLQTNKVKQIIEKVSLIHSVDSLHLAEEINKRAASVSKIQDVLIQINAAGEEQKSGIDPSELPLLLEQINKLSNIRVCGLMHIAPFAENPEDVRIYFKQVKELYERYKTKDFKYLSMGMSNDFETAIEEGSNMVRIGTSIFGARDYGKE